MGILNLVNKIKTRIEDDPDNVVKIADEIIEENGPIFLPFQYNNGTRVDIEGTIRLKGEMKFKNNIIPKTLNIFKENFSGENKEIDLSYSAEWGLEEFLKETNLDLIDPNNYHSTKAFNSFNIFINSYSIDKTKPILGKHPWEIHSLHAGIKDTLLGKKKCEVYLSRDYRDFFDEIFEIFHQDNKFERVKTEFLNLFNPYKESKNIVKIYNTEEASNILGDLQSILRRDLTLGLKYNEPIVSEQEAQDLFNNFIGVFQERKNKLQDLKEKGKLPSGYLYNTPIRAFVYSPINILSEPIEILKNVINLYAKENNDENIIGFLEQNDNIPRGMSYLCEPDKETERTIKFSDKLITLLDGYYDSNKIIANNFYRSLYTLEPMKVEIKQYHHTDDFSKMPQEAEIKNFGIKWSERNEFNLHGKDDDSNRLEYVIYLDVKNPSIVNGLEEAASFLGIDTDNFKI